MEIQRVLIDLQHAQIRLQAIVNYIEAIAESNITLSEDTKEVVWGVTASDFELVQTRIKEARYRLEANSG